MLPGLPDLFLEHAVAPVAGLGVESRFQNRNVHLSSPSLRSSHSGGSQRNPWVDEIRCCAC